MIGADGVILYIRNDHLSRQAITDAEVRVGLARARVKEQQELLDQIMLLDSGRADLKSQYADTFRHQLDTEIATLEQRIAVLSERIGVIRKVAARSDELVRRGTGAEAAADEAKLRMLDLELERAHLTADLDYAHVRRKAANGGVFITANGEDPDWVRGSRIELKMAKKEARLELRTAQAELERAQAALQAEQKNFVRLSEAAVSAPPGAIVWSLRVAPGAAVTAGSPLAEWLDCAVVMVDVPLSDAEVPLITHGMTANVVLEGESMTRQAQVLLTRGSAATLGREDLAAVAKGRGLGVAQVLLEFSQDTPAFDGCPVGRAAYVDFPGIGLIDVIRARLRL